MSPYRRIASALALTPLLLALPGARGAQQAPGGAGRVYSDAELFRKAEADVESLKRRSAAVGLFRVGERAERRLKRILKLHPGTALRGRVEEGLREVRELLADTHLQIARFYYDRPGRGGPRLSAARRHLLRIVDEYPEFSRTEEALFFLAELSLSDERREEAAGHLWKLVCQFPTGRRAPEAFARLNEIGMVVSKGCDNLKTD